MLFVWNTSTVFTHNRVAEKVVKHSFIFKPFLFSLEGSRNAKTMLPNHVTNLYNMYIKTEKSKAITSMKETIKKLWSSGLKNGGFF